MLESGSGAIWTEDSTARLMRGEMDSHVEAIVTGSMRSEGALFIRLFGTGGSNEARMGWIGRYPEPMRVPLDGLYPSSQDDALARIIGDSLFDAPVHHMARQLVKAGKPTVHLYRIDTAPTPMLKEQPDLGPTHAFELPLLFAHAGLWQYDDASEDGRASAALGRAWVDFAYGKDPWARFTAASPQLQVFGAGGATEMESADAWKPREIALWSQLIEKRATM